MINTNCAWKNDLIPNCICSFNWKFHICTESVLPVAPVWLLLKINDFQSIICNLFEVLWRQHKNLWCTKELPLRIHWDSFISLFIKLCVSVCISQTKQKKNPLHLESFKNANFLCTCVNMLKNAHITPIHYQACTRHRWFGFGVTHSMKCQKMVKFRAEMMSKWQKKSLFWEELEVILLCY